MMTATGGRGDAVFLVGIDLAGAIVIGFDLVPGDIGRMAGIPPAGVDGDVVRPDFEPQSDPMAQALAAVEAVVCRTPTENRIGNST